ncbi:MAG: hypothetical protein R2752_19275 [Vicinamibacterales bacterium]
MRRHVPGIRALLVACLVTAAACNGKSSSSSTAPTPAPATQTESFTATIAAGGSTFYSFTVPVNGIISITLTSVQQGGADVGDALALGVGVPQGTGCNPSVQVSATAGVSPQISSTVAAGIYCVQVADPGTLPAPTTVGVSIAHP